MTHFVVNRLLGLQDFVNQLGAKNKKPVKIVVVTKDQPTEYIEPLLEMGHRDFAESRVQPALARWTPLKEKYPDVNLHFVGQLQTNKVDVAIPFFNTIQTVDRPHLAHKLMGCTNPLYIQLQYGPHNQSRGGVLPHQADQLINICRTLGLNIVGAMTIPPLNYDVDECFGHLADFANRHNLPEISIGMSNDFQQAIAAGSTLVRIGRGLFTPNYPLFPQ